MSGETFEAQVNETNNHHESAADYPLEQIRAALRGLRFGQVSIIVQDGVIVQIDRTERRRLRSQKS